MKRMKWLSCYIVILLIVFCLICFQNYFSLPHPKEIQAQTDNSWWEENWAMAGANPQRTSWVAEEVRGKLNPEWYRPIEPYISYKFQIIAANDLLYISTAKGLYALHTGDNPQHPNPGELAWVYPTELPLGHSPTVKDGVLYLGGHDKKIHTIGATPDTNSLPTDSATGYKINNQVIWIFDSQENNSELPAGFETNPLVVNGTVYAGNRDGYMYAVDVATGTLKWKYKTEGPILFSAAYGSTGSPSGTIYFASNDMHAYALNADTGTLVWRSEKLLGGGFHSWWPVVYENHVVFVGSNNYIQGQGNSLGVGSLQDDLDGDALYPNRDDESQNDTIVWPVGDEPGDWAPGTVTIDASRITQYYEDNPTPEDSLLGKPWRRRYFVLDAATGEEYTYDSDGDGNPDHAPVAWCWTHGGTRYPPIIGSDGVLYQHNSYVSHKYIPRGGISGWKFGTQFISRVHEGSYGAVDEPPAVSSGGNVIYWGIHCNNAVGAYDITIPHGESGRSWRYFGYNLHELIPGYDNQYYPQDDSVRHNLKRFGSMNGVHGTHGVQNPPIPYKGKIYLQRGNSVIAWKSTEKPPDKHRSLRTIKTDTTPTNPPVNQLKARLTLEVEKIINAGHLKPGYLVTGTSQSTLAKGRNSYLTHYFHNPGMTFYILIEALPHLPADLQQQVRDYLQDEFSEYGDRAHIGWDQGVSRNAQTFPPEIQGEMGNFGAKSSIYNSTWDYRYGIYGRWKYVQEFPENAEQVFNQIKDNLSIIPPEEDPPSNAPYQPYIKNSFIAGYIGYVNIGKLAGYAETDSELAPYVKERDRLLTERASEFSKDSPFTKDNHKHMITLNVARNFMFMVPELANYLSQNAHSKVQEALEEYERIAPYWFVANHDGTYQESGLHPLYDVPALFQAKAWILKEPYEELVKYLDVPAFARGDLFYIQNLVAAIEAYDGPDPSPTSTPNPACQADVDNSGTVGKGDLIQIISSWSKILTNKLDLNKDYKINGLDLGKVIKYWNQECN